MDDSAKIKEESKEHISNISSLLKVSKDEFSNFLTFKESAVGNNQIWTNFSFD